MVRYFLIFMLGFLLLGCGGGSSSDVEKNPKTASMTIHNHLNSVASIEGVYLRQHGSSVWGEDLLESKINPNSEKSFSLEIKCDKAYDVKALYDNGKDISQQNINISCSTSNESVYFVLHRSTIPEDNIDCSNSGQNKMLNDIMKDTYLWYEHTPDIDYTSYGSLENLLEDLKYTTYDKWSYVTSTQQHQNYYQEGTYLGWGHGWQYDGNKVFITFVYPDSPSDKAGLKRGAEVLEINGKKIAEIENENLWSTILGEEEEGVELTVKVRMDSTIQELTAKRSIVTIKSVLDKRVLNLNSKKIGYLNFKTFIGPSQAELESAFAYFKSQNIDELVLDLRYNGGGSLDIALYLGSLLGGSKVEESVAETLQYNDKFSQYNRSYKFTQEVNALDINQLYVITTANTASASESVMNGLKPFMDVHLIGSKTHGKPVGMHGYSFCDKSVLPVMFKGVNSNGEGDYFGGMDVTCQVADDVTKEFGDITERMLEETLFYIENKKCSSLNLKAFEKIGARQKKRIPLLKGFRGEIGAF
jgi:C-terminal peptidase prc